MPKDRFIADDVFTVRDRLKVAVDRARRGDGPSLIEVRTYRFRGHSMSDPAKYRTKDEVEDHKRNDALQRLERQLEEHEPTSALVADVKQQVEDDLQAALKFAEDSPEPGADILAPTTYAGDFAG